MIRLIAGLMVVALLLGGCRVKIVNPLIPNTYEEDRRWPQ